ncbi:MAG: UPF0058 family protein [Halobacteriota archaeon]|nr:UPF0058 family protein [Halobacteriota archaeon]
MRKEELIQLHMLLAYLKKYFEANGMDDEFEKYQSLNISPAHIHRSKAEHKQAIFILGTELASLISDDEFSGSKRTSVRMQELADRVDIDVDALESN